MEDINKSTDQEPDYRHGYQSGIGGQGKEAYEGYLSSKVNYEWVIEQLIEKKRELVAFSEKKITVIEGRKVVFDNLQEQIKGLSQTTQQVKELERSIADVGSEDGMLRERREKSSTKYSLLAGLIFFVAGVAFVLGDLIISHEIVAYALNIRNSNEAWAFAVGLAMVSVLLKPAYDRLIEEPYIENAQPEARSRYRKFKIGLSIFAVLTLAVLGWFRYEAYRTDKLKEAINKSVRNLQLNAVDPLTGLAIESPELTRKIEFALRNSDELNMTLVNSPWALLSFVLSGVLFAIAGAVSLGMALPVLQHFWYRWFQIDIRLWLLKRRRKRLVKRKNVVYSELTEKMKLNNIAENDLQTWPTIETLNQEEKVLKEEIAGLEEERKLALTDSRILSYGDGYDKGELMKDMMTHEELEQWRRSQMTAYDLALRAKNNPSDRTVVQRSKKTGLRPYQTIRKAITDNLGNEGQEII